MFRKVDTANKRPVHVLFPQKRNHKFSTCLELWCRLLSWNCGCYIFRCGELQSIHHLPKPISLFSINRKLITLVPMEELDQLTQRYLHLFRLRSNPKNCFIWIGDVIFLHLIIPHAFRLPVKKLCRARRRRQMQRRDTVKFLPYLLIRYQWKAIKKIQSSAPLEYFTWFTSIDYFKMTSKYWICVCTLYT